MLKCWLCSEKRCVDGCISGSEDDCYNDDALETGYSNVLYS